MKSNVNCLKFVNKTSLGCLSKFQTYFSGLTNTLESYLEWKAIRKYPDQLSRFSVEKVMIKIKRNRNGQVLGHLGLTRKNRKKFSFNYCLTRARAESVNPPTLFLKHFLDELFLLSVISLNYNLIL